jgi:hypothetical protein
MKIATRNNAMNIARYLAASGLVVVIEGRGTYYFLTWRVVK